MAKIISSNGYSIKKDSLTEKEIRDLKKALIYKPFTVDERTKFMDNSFSLLKESETRYFMPRYFGIRYFGKPDKDKLMNEPDNIINFKTKFEEPTWEEIQKIKEIAKTQTKKEQFNAYRLEIQYSVKNIIEEKLKKDGGAIICLPCGIGKTALSIFLISKRIKVPTLIFVHKEFLAQQWEEEIKQFVDCSIGRIQGKTFDVDNKDIVIVMIQSFIINEYDLSKLKRFQMIIADECHHLAAPIFSNALSKLSTKYTVGLSATPNRKDKLEEVFMNYLGEIGYKLERPPDASVKVDVYYIKNTGQEYFDSIYDTNQKECKPLMISNLCRYPERNEFIVDLIKKFVDEGRNILILSDRCGQKTMKQKIISQSFIENNIHLNETTIENLNNVKHLQILADILHKKYAIPSVIYKGGDKIDKLKEMETKQVLFSTYSMVDEGFNLKKLNTLIMTTPNKSNLTEQTRGRIMRDFNDEFPPIIVDIVDNFSNYNKKGQERIKDYRKNEYNITEYLWEDGKISNYQKKQKLQKTNKVKDMNDIINLLNNTKNTYLFND